MEIRDADGSVIYAEESVGTKAFEVKVSGKISVRVDGEAHKGSFRFE